MKKIALVILSISLFQAATAQEYSWKQFDFSLDAGFNIGATTPIGIPAQIRKIETFNPLISLSLGGNATYWINERWGVSTGIHFENKGMSNVSHVKEYKLLLETKEGKLEGLFSGEVKTVVHNGYMTVPLTANYHVSEKINLLAGFYYAYLLTPSFSGSAYNGYFRTGESGHEYNMEMTEPSNFPDTFSDALNKHDYGVSAGVEWFAFKHFFVAGKLDWGLHSIFSSDFKGIDVSLYNVFVNGSFGYKF
jgi:hypothetical protein